mmetsp:Transcript_107872/g.230349  ORF Transcript_107872/g.230349 Transcript_107872/m.230349 type:complete len:242 (-) Transcript_107872:580-1305(-)
MVCSCSRNIRDASAWARSAFRVASSASTTSARSSCSRWIACLACSLIASTSPLSLANSRVCAISVSPALAAASAAADFDASSSVASCNSAFTAMKDPSHRMRAKRAKLSASLAALAMGRAGSPLSTRRAKASERGSAALTSPSWPSQASQSAPVARSCSSASLEFTSSSAFSSSASRCRRSFQYSARTASSPTERSSHSSFRARRASFMALAKTRSGTGKGCPPGTGKGAPSLTSRAAAAA